MATIDEHTLTQILSQMEGVEVVSYGKPRDGFELPADVPHWTSGYGGKYEMVHTNVPKGTMIAVGNLEDLDINNFDKLKQQLKEIDIYPTGHDGNFKDQDVAQLKKWFFSRSMLDNKANNQDPIASAKKLTPEGLGASKYQELVDYLADEMNIFKDNLDKNGALVPADKEKRIEIVKSLLDGLSQSVRYTRLDAPARAFQLVEEVWIQKPSGGQTVYNLKDEAKIVILRTDADGHLSTTPLDHAMMDKTYITKDGKPLGDRGIVSLDTIFAKAFEMQEAGRPVTVTIYPRLIIASPA